MELVGKKAPAFTLRDTDEKNVSLKDYLGKWVVIYFYPKDNTPGCTVEACEFTDEFAGFEKIGATVLGVSKDSSASHQKFREKYNLKVRLLSDPDAHMMENYGAWGKKMLYGRMFNGVKRSTVIIDPSGKVVHWWKAVKAKGHAALVKKKLLELQG
ncbi:MAG: thioredoxin-dependent thiol peroxidase [Candidatus Woesearchaeota archaeon]|nr:MAG: thioredoxin-dependent thiol peroxidase [Candidatus Woesearchaeota archaeon]